MNEDRFSHFRIARIMSGGGRLNPSGLLSSVFRALGDAILESGSEGAQLVSVMDPEVSALPEEYVTAASVSLAEAVDRIGGQGFARMHSAEFSGGHEEVSMVGIALDRPGSTALDVVIFWTVPATAKRLMPMLTKLLNTRQIPIPAVH
jgi:hypothetical protein